MIRTRGGGSQPQGRERPTTSMQRGDRRGQATNVGTAPGVENSLKGLLIALSLWVMASMLHWGCGWVR